MYCNINGSSKRVLEISKDYKKVVVHSDDENGRKPASYSRSYLIMFANQLVPLGHNNLQDQGYNRYDLVSPIGQSPCALALSMLFDQQV